MIKYPDDFKSFHGCHLSPEGINKLVQDAIVLVQKDDPEDFNDSRGIITTGDTKIEIYEFGHITVWKQVAAYWGCLCQRK